MILLWHNLVVVTLPSLEGFTPSACAEAPLTPALKTYHAEVITLGGGKGQELLCDLG